jgi:hypothetical protein
MVPDGRGQGYVVGSLLNHAAMRPMQGIASKQQSALSKFDRAGRREGGSGPSHSCHFLPLWIFLFQLIFD